MSVFEEKEARYIINTYNRRAGINPVLVRGEGSLLWDEQGNEYLDLLSGLGVNVVGHCHPAVVEAAREQLGRLIHTSNLYYTIPQIELAGLLVEHSAADQVFFANSGAEANEAAIKLTRKYFRQKGSRRYEIITAYRSFHGRTLATVSATAQQKYHQGFDPLVQGFFYATFNDLSSFAALIGSETAAVMIEPVQGEGGVHVSEESFIRGLRELCDKEGLLLIFDEVQCGLGRTGRLWAYENWHVQPDIFTTAKGLGGGLPIGVMLAAGSVAGAFKPGDHASTFGGNPVACAAALAVIKILHEEGFLEHVRQKGHFWQAGLWQLSREYLGLVREVRGLGLISCLELQLPRAQDIQRLCQKRAS